MHILVTASRALLAWMVHMPGTPLFSAMSRSRLSSWRTSPTMMRDGRIRSASLTSRRSGISPVPSRLGWRHCIDATSRSGILSSKTSSHVTTRSRGGIAAARQLSSVVLPACVPPATRMLRPLDDGGLEEPRRLPRQGAEPHEVVEVVGLDDELADVDRASASRVMSGMTTCSRDPSGSVASTKGERQVDAPARRLEHPLDEVAHLVGGEDRRGQLGDAAAGDEDLCRLVDPDLLDLGVVEVLLQRPEPGDGVEHRLHGALEVAQRRETAVQ